jgi:hypothetical protein
MEGIQKHDALLVSSARRLTGRRREFIGEVTWELCCGNPRLAERRFGCLRDILNRMLSSGRMTASPERCAMPKTGGFSLALVPRPHAPFRRRRGLRQASANFSGWPLYPATP